jgi:hypothetical protein
MNTHDSIKIMYEFEAKRLWIDYVQTEYCFIAGQLSRFLNKKIHTLKGMSKTFAVEFSDYVPLRQEGGCSIHRYFYVSSNRLYLNAHIDTWGNNPELTNYDKSYNIRYSSNVHLGDLIDGILISIIREEDFKPDYEKVNVSLIELFSLMDIYQDLLMEARRTKDKIPYLFHKFLDRYY